MFWNPTGDCKVCTVCLINACACMGWALTSDRLFLWLKCDLRRECSNNGNESYLWATRRTCFEFQSNACGTPYRAQSTTHNNNTVHVQTNRRLCSILQYYIHTTMRDFVDTNIWILWLCVCIERNGIALFVT